MPHDANNQVLTVGSRVYVPCDVKSIDAEGEELCNVTLETCIGRKPDGQKLILSANAAQVVKEPPGAALDEVEELRSRNRFLEGEVTRLAKPLNDALLAPEPAFAGEVINCGCGKAYHTATDSPQCPDHAPLIPAVETVATTPDEPVPPAL